MEDVVIVGGGFTGAAAAKLLSKNKKVNLKLVDQKPYFTYTPSLPRLIWDPAYLEKITVEYESFLGENQFLKAQALEIADEKLKTTVGTLGYDHLILCPGSEYPVPLDGAYTVATTQGAITLSRKLPDAQSVLVAGGGLVAVEAAAEVATAYPGKKITLVHAHERLIERNTPKASELAKKFLEKNNVDILFEDKVTSKRDTYVTESGKQIRVDVCIWGAGVKAPALKGLNPKRGGPAPTDEYLRHSEYENVYVGGDAADLKEEKTAHHANEHAHHIVANMNRTLQGKKPKPYVSHEAPLIISLGRKDAIFSYKSTSYCGRLPAQIKHVLERIAVRRFGSPVFY